MFFKTTMLECVKWEALKDLPKRKCTNYFEKKDCLEKKKGCLRKTS